MKFIVPIILMILVLSGCDVDIGDKSVPATTPLSFDEKIKQGKNTGTQADIYNNNPYSVFDTYSPWNQFQN